MKKKRIIWIISLLVVVIVTLIVLKKTGVIGGEEGTKVATEAASQRTIIETVNASGKIYPEVEVKMSSDVSGEITELTVAEGDSVRRGQVLARVYADIYNIQQQQAAAVVSQQEYQVANTTAQLEGLRSAMIQTEAQYNRQKKLLDGKVISRQEFEVAENAYNAAKANYNAALRQIDASRAAVASARANLRRASTDVSRTTIVSPMDGVVSLLNVKKGERVVGTAQMAGTEMMRIADMSRLEVRVDVTENDIPKVHLGDSALISVDAYLNRKFKGVVYQIASSNTGAATASAAASANDVTNYKVYIRLLPESYADLLDPNKPLNFPFRPGMTASADIQTRIRNNALSVPINAVTTRDKDGDKKEDKEKTKGPGQDEAAPVASEDDEKDVVVFVYEKATGTVKQVKVTTGIQDTRYIEVTGGLTKGQEVVSEPYNVIFRTLKDGMKVLVVDKSKLFETKK
ncbi:MAG: efflux RND transporter periplasmic adaptor subunit [Chitinophagaceae bacterium]|jgi:HlyD family secretion protein|nr:efflux RND transporter periplasmic adaptor subunit [Chitinophagaceae bacterium]